jgi:hypothetical protein
MNQQQRVAMIDSIIVQSGMEEFSKEEVNLRKQLFGMPSEDLQKIAERYALIRAEAAQAVANDPTVIAQREQIAQAEAENVWRQFFLRHLEIKDHAGNRKMLFDRALSLSDDGVVRLQHLHEAATVSGLDRQEVKKPLTVANLRQDAETLRKFCRGRFQFNTAALDLLREKFGAGFTAVEIDQALQAHLISFRPASEEELVEYRREVADERAEYLANQASPEELRQAARQEAEERRLAAQQEFVREQDEAGRKRAAESGKPQLPEVNSLTGEKLDATFFNKLSVTDRQEFRRYVGFYGGNQIVDRMRGIR